MKITKTILVLIFLLLLMVLSVSSAAAQGTQVVRALLFYSPTCAHCHKVITEDLPPLFEQYGDQLIILGIDVTNQAGSEFFQTMLEQLEYPPEQAGVPFMLVGDTVLVGDVQIPEELPLMIEDGLSGTGIPWPELPVVREFLLAQGFIDADGQDTLPTQAPEQPTEIPASPVPTETVQDTPEPTPTDLPPTPTVLPENNEPTEEVGFTVLDQNTPATDPSSVVDRFNRDTTANAIAVVVLLMMIVVVVWIGIQFMQAATPTLWPEWILPILLVVGFAIAVYLGTIEVTGNEAICGPVGDCNAVQQSKYAKLFGVLPVAVLGMFGYLAIGTSWLIGRKTTGNLQFYAKMAMFLFALLGLLFFIYLTFLEPFVIGATCAWCISSAIIMTVIALYATQIALNAWADTDIEENEA